MRFDRSESSEAATDVLRFDRLEFTNAATGIDALKPFGIYAAGSCLRVSMELI